MVLDASAILAILFKEPERDTFATAISDAGVRLVSSVNAFEAAVVVLARKGAAGLPPIPGPRIARSSMEE